MFIDTATANSRSSRPQVIISPSPYNDGVEPEMDAFVGQASDVPPPTYLEATTPGLYTSRLSGEEGARLLSFDGREAGDATYKEEQYARRTLRSQCCMKRNWIKSLGLLLGIMMLSAMLALMLAAVVVRNDKHSKVTTVPQSAQSAQDEASHPQGFIDDDSDKPDLIAIPWPSPSATSKAPKQVFPIRWPAKCGKQYNVKTEMYDFTNSKELNIQEAVHQLDGPYKRVAGWIHVARAPDEQTPGTIQVKLSYAVSKTIDVNSVKYSQTPSGLVIGDPTFPDGFDGVRPGTACLGMSVVVFMAPGASLENLKVSSLHMGMQVHSGANFNVTDTTSISLTTGTLDAIKFSSRQTNLQTISGSISGKYALMDLLSVTTKSGSVNIDIEPQAAAPGSTNPAVFMVDSLSGSIRTDFKRKHIPERDYQTYINTTVGSVDGTFIHGSKTEINSVAGLVTADILPFKSGDYKSEIYTHTRSGKTALTLRTPYKARRIPMNGLTSTHKSTSGEIVVTYPQEWTGMIDGTSMNGELHLQGKDLELLKENDTPGKNHVEAKKGNGASSLTFDTVSGGCEIKIGKLK
ncbi:hypothetical protein HRS9139_02300 [Pyrenophora teres f. teres]|uniref:Herpes-BLLF1 multi-domain protein n=1 Tax=Pyrenophora teres f. teres TaxID=97479 RepID=A0A6S6VVX1_9PLEO|nr:hypothetical protein HRS9139_02300 [Pyrenophora teres f. teres]KAE8852035.1 hypothetical protein HRS9122_02322 [Pyrenophora teres f. teres]CAE7013923.1 Herpes-BLLF1 multi-domain protein [Pyrenophora teres f. teres]